MLSDDEIDQIGDNAPTPRGIWSGVYRYFRRHHKLGFVLEPCAGDGRLFDIIREPKTWCEVQRGRDFHDYIGPRPDTIMTNPPWMDRLTPIIQRAVEITNRHLILLAPVRTIYGSRKRHRLIRAADFRTRTIILLPRYSNLPDPRRPLINSPNEFTRGGIQIAVVHWQKGYRGKVTERDWNLEQAKARRSRINE